MEQNPPWEANSRSASQEIPRLWRNPKVHYRIYKSPPLIPILSQVYPVHTFPPTSLSSILSLSSHLRLGLPSGLFFSWFPTTFCMRFSQPPCVLHVPPWLDQPNNNRWSVHVTKLLIMQSCRSKSDIYFPLPRSFQRIRPIPRPRVTCRNKLIVYVEELLAPNPTLKFQDHLLSAVRKYLFSILAVTLHMWR